MKKIVSKVYADYPEQPYISPERDLALWTEYPEKFPYSKVERKQMFRTEENVLPGDIILLWRISLNTFTNESDYPNYFEYKYGINGPDSLKHLIELGYAYECSATDSIIALNMVTLKRIMRKYKLDLKGKKMELVNRVLAHIDESQLKDEFTLRNYRITEKGKDLLNKYAHLIMAHGPKM